MEFGNMGMGFLPTDSRQKKLPKGGSIHAGQPSDTSSIITGNPTDSIGFASSAARGDLFAKPYVAPKPDYKKTAEEIVDDRAASGVATSHQNMGSIAVDFRASEQAKADAGEQTVRGARESKILDARAAAEYQRTILDPATEEATRFRAQAAAAKDMFGTKMSSNLSSYKSKPSSGLGFNVPSNKGKLSGGGDGYSGNTVGGYSGDTTGPKHGGILGQVKSDFRDVRANDPTGLAAQRAHAAAPGTQEQNWMDMANAQSASGKATPGEMAQAAVAMYSQKIPNK